MDFLADVWVTCPVCAGKRFNRETLHARFKGKSISDVLEMDVQEALGTSPTSPRSLACSRPCTTWDLITWKLGQGYPTLSGGEAQRIKRDAVPNKRGTGRHALYPRLAQCTGLHFGRCPETAPSPPRLHHAGNTVVVIEHNLDVVKTADWLIDLGPEGSLCGPWSSPRVRRKTW